MFVRLLVRISTKLTTSSLVNYFLLYSDLTIRSDSHLVQLWFFQSLFVLYSLLVSTIVGPVLFDYSFEYRSVLISSIIVSLNLYAVRVPFNLPSDSYLLDLYAVRVWFEVRPLVRLSVPSSSEVLSVL
ncbi:hypothetical protein NP233_g7002 [Leucocoprinus birnbaumii]|uniref:Uncharacterized protein n=1 Tax=Leucocoprinus birnbaumii TaxID=56174 RepID=A0AAD5VQ17_9AGAR|nr:hypothetical protein NP233_g7002 [Leucocoprinus birnbaumii]